MLIEEDKEYKMSTYYYFVCNGCNKKSDGVYTRQMWGWGNADIIDCFQFIMKHTDNCGHEKIAIFSEDDREVEFYNTDEVKQELNCYFPRSEDWNQEEQAKRFEEHRAAIKVSSDKLDAERK